MQRVEKIVSLLDEKKAENIQAFDLKDSDYFVEKVIIASTLGERHGPALLEYLKKLLKEMNERILFIEESEEWIVIDLGDLLIHIMSPEYRSRYNIEEFLQEIKEKLKE